MPIIVKSPREIELMRQAGKITAQARTIARQAIRDGVTTGEIDKEVYDFITKSGATPSFLNYGGFPGSACISVNEVVIHGIPNQRKLKEGDVVSVDVGAYIGGFHGDCAATATSSAWTWARRSTVTTVTAPGPIPAARCPRKRSG